jgi:hypothetical protein
MAQSQAVQSQATGKIHSSRSIIAGGLLAGVAAAVAFTVASPAAPAASAQAAMATTSEQQCDMAPRKLMVSTAAEWSGVIRLREGSYLSQPIVLTSTPQSVVFPRPRPEINPEDEIITVEGNVSSVVISSELTSFRKELNNIDGAAPFTVRWAPRKPCQER